MMQQFRPFVLFVTAVAIFAHPALSNGIHDLNGDVISGLAPEEVRVGQHGSLEDREPSIPLYRSSSRSSPPPYVPPPGNKYNTSGGPVPGKINVHLVPHTHDDTGWQVTVDQYFYREVYYIVDTVIQNLIQDPNRRFIYVETGFFARWWNEASEFKRNQTRMLVERGQLEFINGGWCMHDEASPKWEAMVDQTTRGHQFLLKNFGPAANPRGTWQIDPFGHSNTQAWLLSAEAGMESLFWGRTDYQDFNARHARSGLEWIWEGSESLGDEARIFAGALYGTGGGGYSTWIGFDGTDDQVQDDPERHDYNADQWVDKFVQDALEQANHTLTDHQLWACGTDFQYQNADHWYTNLDKLIHYVNQNGTVNAFYSTPSIYVDAKKTDKKVTWELRRDDIFPLADNAHHYWSGYFTSRPALKRQVRFATNLLAAARQLEVVTGVTAENVNAPTEKRAPQVGDSWTDALEGAVGVATHHDGMSGTERQDVTDDYEQRIAESSVETEVGVGVALGKLTSGAAGEWNHCNCNAALDCLNISVCEFTSSRDAFTVLAWNPLAQATTSILRIPVVDGEWTVSGADDDAQLVPLDARTKRLPLAYLNRFGMNASQIEAAEKALANDATHELVFSASVPAMGFATFVAKRAGDRRQEATTTGMNNNNANTFTVSSDAYELTFDNATGLLTRVRNLVSGASQSVSMTMGWYNSSVGGCTKYSDDVPANIREPACDGQKSGAYIFRSNSSTLFYPGPKATPVLTIVANGTVSAEVSQRFSDWATAVYRLYRGQPYVEVEWTVGPIPMDTPWIDPVVKGQANLWGKEVVMKYATDLDTNGVFYTDSNGRELIRREYNKRGPSYPSPYNISEEVAGNYYPVNAMMSVDDGKTELSVVVDVTVAGASLADGELELMVHRRIQDDDSRGVQEPLNETMCGCNDINAAPGAMGENGHEGDGGCECDGLVMRGRQWLVLDATDSAHATRRTVAESLHFPPTLAFAESGGNVQKWSAIQEALPANVKLQTLTNNYAAFNDGQWLLRLAHLYQVDEHPTLAKPVEVDLVKVFSGEGGRLKIVNAVEVSLTANQLKSEMDAKKFDWKVDAGVGGEAVKAQFAEGETRRASSGVRGRGAFDFPVVTLNPMEVRTFLARFE